MSETWRVVLADGSVQTLTREDVASLRRGYDFRDDDLSQTDRMAVMCAAVGHGFQAVEILAPGEPTRAELLATEERLAAAVAEERDGAEDIWRHDREALDDLRRQITEILHASEDVLGERSEFARTMSLVSSGILPRDEADKALHDVCKFVVRALRAGGAL